MLEGLLLAVVVSLNGLWDFKLEVDRSMEEVALPSFVADDKMVVPGAWDAMSRYYNRRGTGCYRRTFELGRDCVNAFLVVDGCCLRSRYWLDGREIGFSKLPWSKFEFATGPLKAGRHELVAAVDSIVDNAKVKLFWDFYDFYAPGGFHHGVWLETQQTSAEIRKVIVRTRDYATGRIELEAQYASDGPADFTAELSFDGGAAKSVAFRNRRATLNVPDFRLWSPEHPNLHRLTLATTQPTTNNQQLTTTFGIRQVGTEKGRITLNGRPIYLKGVNRHESHYEFGATTPVQLMYEDIQNLKDLGGNFIRGSHYAQCEAFLSLCDELGVMVWEESLGWGNKALQLKDPEFRRLQEEETRLMVRNSINHPCVIVSAFLNEPDSQLPACKSLVERLIDVIRAEDTGHLVTFACHRNTSDISHEKTDIIAYNTYPCWYGYQMQTGTNEEMYENIGRCHRDIVKYFRDKYGDDRPIVVSETGVKADYGVRDPRGRAQYTEDFQAEYEKAMLEEIFANDDIGGVMIWQFTDAKTYTRRTGGMINRAYGVNTGGLYDLYRRPKLVVEDVRRLFRSKDQYLPSVRPQQEPMRPLTTRRYLQGPESERIALFLRDGKVTLGEVDYAHDWRSLPYTNEIAHGVWLVQGAGDEPFDMSEARLRIDPDGVPVHGQAWTKDGVETDLEACAPFGLRPTVQLRLQVTNRSASVRDCRWAFLPRTAAEGKLIPGAPDLYCEYHPVVTDWLALATTWSPSGNGTLVDGDRFLTVSGEPTGTWDAAKGALRFSVTLRPGESRTVDVALGRGTVERPAFERTRRECRASWAAELGRVRDRQPLVRAMTVQMLQCFSRATDGTFLPRQGGQQRWVWPGETIAVVEALSRLGYHDYVEKSLALFLDGGYPQPSGEIGPFGNGWAGDTACIVRMFAHHCFTTDNRTLWMRWREPVLRAFDWIRSTRASTAKQKGCVEGLFPPLKSTDMADKFQNWGLTDLLNLDALERLAEAAERFGDARAAEIRGEAKDYRRRIADLLDVWRQKAVGKKEFPIPFSPDGSYEEQARRRHFFFSHPGFFADCGFLDAADMLRVRAWLLKEGVADGKGFYMRHLTLPKMGNDTWYTTCAEHHWFQAWRRVGRDDLAKEILEALLARSVTAETLVGERVDDRHPWFFPWSPNASGAARIVLMLLDI